jgi:hypothetical protein
MITTISFILNSRPTVAGLLRPKRMQVHPQQDACTREPGKSAHPRIPTRSSLERRLHIITLYSGVVSK